MISKASVLLCGVCAFVPVWSGAARADKTSLSAADKDFINKATEDNLSEIKLGQLAVEKGQSTAVKDLGRHLVDDHTRANADLKQLADNQGLTLPMEMSASDKGAYDKLASLSGADFDKSFIDHQVTDHQHDVAEFQKEASRVKNPALKSWVNQVLPTLRQHEEMARRDQKMM